MHESERHVRRTDQPWNPPGDRCPLHLRGNRPCGNALPADRIRAPPGGGLGARERRAARLNYGKVVAPLVEDGIAVFSYDKRGVGESEGDCCTSPGKYNLVAADADGAVLAVRSHPEIDPDRVGFYGASEAGWVVPLADARLSKPVAFTALVDGPAVTTGEEKVWSETAGEEEDGPLTAEKKADATQRLQDAGPSGFDPAPYIERMSSPGLWLYGGADKSIPTDRSVEILSRMKRAGKDFTIVVFPDAGHGLVDNVPTAPEAPATLVNWIKKTAKAS